MQYRVSKEEQKMLETEFLYQDQENDIGIIAAYCEKDLPLYHVSKRMLGMMGYEQMDELMRDADGKLTNLIHLEDLQQIFQEMDENYYEGKLYESIFRMRYRDGSWSWMAVKGCVRKVEEDRLALIVQCMDLGTVLRTKKALEQQNYISSQMLQNLPGGYHRCLGDEGFTFLHISKRFLDMLGWTREEIETKFDNKFLNMIHPEDRDVIDGYVNCLLTTQEGESTQEQIYRLLGKDGYHWVADNTMHMDIGGKRVFQGFLSDITPFMEEKEKEQTERENLRITQLSVLENQLSAQRQYLDILSRKYILVYYVDLAEDLGNVLKLDMHANVWRMPKMRPGTYFSYEAHIKKFAERFVLDTDKKKFQEMLHKDYIESCLKTTARYTFRFNSVPNLVGNQHYKIYVMRANPDQYDGKVMVISEEIDDVISMEQQQKAELDMERRYLNVLTKDFAVVYHVKLEENTSKLIKVDEVNSKKEAKKISLRELNDYQERVELYSQKYVVPALRNEFRHVMDAKHIRRRLRNANRFAYRYRTMFGEKGQQYFEMIAMRMDEEKECKDALIAFRRIDEVVTAEQQRQIELEERLEEERNQNEILSALGKIYHAIFWIDLLSDTYTEISCREEMRRYFDGEETSASRTLANLCDEIIDERYRKSMREFFDLSTLAKRLRHQEFVEREYHKGWKLASGTNDRETSREKWKSNACFVCYAGDR